MITADDAGDSAYLPEMVDSLKFSGHPRLPIQGTRRISV
jgi:hypothetical protein